MSESAKNAVNEKVSVSGTVAPGFEGVVKQYEDNFYRDDVYQELGSSLCVYHRGQRVVDLWAGHQDREKTRPWEAGTTICIYSTTKALAALCAAVLVDRGAMNYSDPVSRHWPEFNVSGTEATTVAHLLSHQSGHPALREPTELDDLMNWDLICERLATQEPYWEPGTFTAYHGWTYGYLVGEVIKRVSGKSIGQFLQEEIAAPLNADAFIGLPESVDHNAATLYGPKLVHDVPDLTQLPEYLVAAMTNPVLDPESPNRREWRASEMPATCGYASARGLAAIFNVLALGGTSDGKELISDDALTQMTTVISTREDGVLGKPVDWAHGVVNNGLELYGPNPRAFGHSGWGGSFVSADRENQVAMGFVCNQMGPDPIGDARTLPVIDEIYRAIQA